MIKQPLIVAIPPWYRRSMWGLNPWGWRSLATGHIKVGPDGCVEPEGYFEPGDGYGGRYYWDSDYPKEPPDTGVIIKPDFWKEWP